MNKPVHEIVATFVDLLNVTQRPPQVIAAALLIAQGEIIAAAQALGAYSDSYLIEVAESLRDKVAKEHGVARIFSFNDAKWLDKDSVDAIKAALQRAGLTDDETDLALRKGESSFEDAIKVRVTLGGKITAEEIKAALQRAGQGMSPLQEGAPVLVPINTEANTAFKVPPEDRPDALQPPATSVQDDERTAREAFVMTERTLIKRMRDRAHAAKLERDDVLHTDLSRGADRMHTKLAAFIVQHNMEGI